MTLARETAAERLVFMDEMGTNTSLHPLYACSPRGERAHCFVPRNRGPNTNHAAGEHDARGYGAFLPGMGPSCLAVEGAITGIVFETYIERVLVPSLRQGKWW